MNLGYIRLFRASEYCITQSSFDYNVHLCICDIELDRDLSMRVFIKNSKTDKFSNGQNVVIGCSRNKVCAVCTMTKYLKRRNFIFGAEPHGPLFVFTNGCPLTGVIAQNQHINVVAWF